MRARRLIGRWATRGGLALIAVSLFSVVATQGAQAATPVGAGSLTPFLNCYWDNGDDTVTVSLGVTSSNPGQVAVYVGANNQVTQGVADRGQPETFDNGMHNNVWSFTVSNTEISNGIDWQLTGTSVAVAAVVPCATRPQMATGSNGMAVLAFAAVTTVVGGYCLTGRTGRRRQRDLA